MRFSLVKFLSISVILITISSVNANSSLQIGNTFIWWAIYIGILFSFYQSKYEYYNLFNERYILPIKIYLFWNFICIIRGLFIAENYWEWKNLVGMGMVLLLPISIYVSTNKFLVQHLTAMWLKYALPAFILIVPFLHGAALGRYLVPISFLTIFFPLLNTRWKVFSILICLFVIVSDLSARSNVIKFALPFLLSLIYYFKFLSSVGMLNTLRLILLFLPFLLFTLAVTGKFNVFRMDDYLGNQYTAQVVVNGQLQQESLTADTRSPLYVEVLESAIKYDYVIFGRTPARGNESISFGNFAFDELKTGKLERYVNEVSILNVFTWTGIVGVLLYFYIFYKGTYLAICRSSNTFSKIVGVYVSFRWSYAWVEDFSNFDLSYLFLWLMIGMCFSASFRSMTNMDMKNWVMGILDRSIKTASIKSLKLNDR
jgi:hypothetical protein